MAPILTKTRRLSTALEGDFSELAVFGITSEIMKDLKRRSKGCCGRVRADVVGRELFFVFYGDPDPCYRFLIEFSSFPIVVYQVQRFDCASGSHFSWRLESEEYGFRFEVNIPGCCPVFEACRLLANSPVARTLPYKLWNWTLPEPPDSFDEESEAGEFDLEDMKSPESRG